MVHVHPRFSSWAPALVRTMRAILVKDDKGPADNLYLGEAEKPVPGPGKVLVKVRDHRRQLVSYC